MYLLPLLSAVGCNAPIADLNTDSGSSGVDLTVCPEGGPTGNRVGDCAPDFSLIGDDGGFHSLRHSRGSVTFVDFSSAW